jgi:hypothetical protein
LAFGERRGSDGKCVNPNRLGCYFLIHDSLQRPHEPKSHRAGISACCGDCRATQWARWATGCDALFPPIKRRPSMSGPWSPRQGRPRLLTVVFHRSKNGGVFCNRVWRDSNKPAALKLKGSDGEFQGAVVREGLVRWATLLSPATIVVAFRQPRHSKLSNSGCTATAGRLRTNGIGSPHLEHLGSSLGISLNCRSGRLSAFRSFTIRKFTDTKRRAASERWRILKWRSSGSPQLGTEIDRPGQ